MSAFILDAATLAAEHALADRTVFRLSEEQWAAFDELLNRPARDLPKLRELLDTPTILDELTVKLTPIQLLQKSHRTRSSTVARPRRATG